MEYLIVDEIGWVLIISLTDSLRLVVTVTFLWLFLLLALIILHSLV